MKGDLTLEWKEIASNISKIAPTLARLIENPVSTVATVATSLLSAKLGVVNTPTAVSEALKADPEAAVKLAQIESEQKVELQRLLVGLAQDEVAADTARLATVNQTMQTEVGSEHWQTYSWRPCLGFAIAANIVITSLMISAVFLGVVCFRRPSEILGYIPAMLGAMTALVAVVSPILGIASYWRGKAQADPEIPSQIQLPFRKET